MLGALIMKVKARSGFRKLNRRDVQSFMDEWRDDAVFVYPGKISVSGEHKGKERIARWWGNFLDQFPEATFTCKGIYLKHIFAFGPSNEIVLHWEVSTKNREGSHYQNSGMSHVKIKNGKILFFKDYFFDLDNQRKAWSEGERQAP